MNQHESFITSSRPHILMITNHGVHQWQVIPGLPDTGGQNVFVNQFSDSLVQQGYKVTITNRGGYPHPISGIPQVGLHYKDENQRILYLEDSQKTFIRKEDMASQLPELALALKQHQKEEDLKIDLIISHYWDGAMLGLLYNRSQAKPVTHIWVPHSLGEIKKNNVTDNQWAGLRIGERIQRERLIVREVDGIASTSAAIEISLKEDYGYLEQTLFLPPCVDPDRYHPRIIPSDHQIYTFLSQHCGLSPSQVANSQIITEISRTDSTKRKDVLIKAFAMIEQKHPNAMLVMSIDPSNEALSTTLINLINELGIEKRVAVLGSVWEQLPQIYAVSDIFCTPSIMEGFGMTSQEAAVTAVPVVASHLVPFVTEYLLGKQVEELVPAEGGQPIKVGQGAVVVHADDINGFAYALDLLLSDASLRSGLGKCAYQITIPYFTWKNVVTKFLQDIKYKG